MLFSKDFKQHIKACEELIKVGDDLTLELLVVMWGGECWKGSMRGRRAGEIWSWEIRSSLASHFLSGCLARHSHWGYLRFKWEWDYIPSMSHKWRKSMRRRRIFQRTRITRRTGGWRNDENVGTEVGSKRRRGYTCRKGYITIRTIGSRATSRRRRMRNIISWTVKDRKRRKRIHFLNWFKSSLIW